MLSEEYIANVLKTASHDWPSIKGRLSNETVLEMLHAAIGMSTEAAELLDMLKKHIFYGKKLDLVNIEEEIGDSDWYKGLMVYALRCNRYATSFEQIWEKNIEKLRARYGESFSESCALNRDLEKERTILEKGKVQT